MPTIKSGSALTAPEKAPPAEPDVSQSKRSTVARRLTPYGYLSPTVLLIVVLMVRPSGILGVAAKVKA